MDFGLRRATVDLARATASQAIALIELTQLDVATSAADAFLALLAAEQSARAAQANVERLETFSKSVHVLVENQLRAGADESRADAELAAARIQLIQAQQTVEINRANLARALDPKTRTMPVELDVENSKGRLAPGMYAEVIWPTRRSQLVVVRPGLERGDYY